MPSAGTAHWRGCFQWGESSVHFRYRSRFKTPTWYHFALDRKLTALCLNYPDNDVSISQKYPDSHWKVCERVLNSPPFPGRKQGDQHFRIFDATVSVHFPG